MKTGIRIETWQVAGRWQEESSDRFAGAKRPLSNEVDMRRIPEAIVEIYKEANRKAYELLPKGAGKLNVRADYELPKHTVENSQI
jgi:hypothetical protein